MQHRQFVDEESWLRARRDGIGASESAAALGLSPWRSRLAVYQSKAEEFETEPQIVSAKMRLGIALEEGIRLGVSIGMEQAILYHGRFFLGIHDEHEWLRSSFDGFIGDQVLEIKTTDPQSLGFWESGIPIDYRIQVQHEMLVSGKASALLVQVVTNAEFWNAVTSRLSERVPVYTAIGGAIAEDIRGAGNYVRFHQIARDEELQKTILKGLKEFWALVEAKTPPEPDSSESAKETILAMFPNIRGTTVKLPRESVDWIATIWDCQEKISHYRDVLEEAKNKLRLAIGENTFGIVEGIEGRVTSKEITVGPRAGYSYRDLRVPKRKTGD